VVLENEHHYNRVVEVYTYHNARKSLVAAREVNQTAECATTLIWEADQRLNNVIGGSYATYRELLHELELANQLNAQHSGAH
jgi:hypothetical protein